MYSLSTNTAWNFPGGLVGNTKLCSPHAGGKGSILGQATRSHRLQLAKQILKLNKNNSTTPATSPTALTDKDTDIGIPCIGYLLLHRNLFQNPMSAGRQVSIGSTVFLMSRGTDSFWSRLSSTVVYV